MIVKAKYLAEPKLNNKNQRYGWNYYYNIRSCKKICNDIYVYYINKYNIEDYNIAYPGINLCKLQTEKSGLGNDYLIDETDIHNNLPNLNTNVIMGVDEYLFEPIRFYDFIKNTICLEKPEDKYKKIESFHEADIFQLEYLNGDIYTIATISNFGGDIYLLNDNGQTIERIA